MTLTAGSLFSGIGFVMTVADIGRAIQVASDAIYANTWTEPRPDDPHPDFHRRFAAWQASLAAELAVKALDEAGLLAHNDGDER